MTTAVSGVRPLGDSGPGDGEHPQQLLLNCQSRPAYKSALSLCTIAILGLMVSCNTVCPELQGSPALPWTKFSTFCVGIRKSQALAARLRVFQHEAYDA